MCLSCTGHVSLSSHGVVSWSWHPDMGNTDRIGILRLAQASRFNLLSLSKPHHLFLPSLPPSLPTYLPLQSSRAANPSS